MKTRKKIAVNPKLPKNFDCTPNEERPKSHQRWWCRPYIVTEELDNFEQADEEFRKKWLEAWHSGVRYDVRCLDGGAWDRSTSHGSYATLDEALDAAASLLLLYSGRC